MIIKSIFAVFIFFAPGLKLFSQNTSTHDVVIYGGTSAAISSAVQVKRMGRSVVVLSPDIRIGGLSSSGLGWTDSGNKKAIGGIAREFYHRVWRHYQSVEAWKWQDMEDYGNRGQGSPAIDGDRRTMWIFEPNVAASIFESWIKENDLEVIRNERLDRENGIDMKNGEISSVTTLSGNKYFGKVFIDCTYEGDLMAAVGVDYFVGREANSVYGETLGGVQTKNARHHQFEGLVDPYKQAGNPASGLLARISQEPPGPEGSGDSKVQAYNFRLCLTKIEENKAAFPKPANYDPAEYELLLRTLKLGSRHIFEKFDPIPNAKTDTNNHGPFSTDNIGMNYAYPEASYEEREEIIKEHEEYQKGYFYFLCNDPRVPAEVSERMSQWGLAKDEFEDNENWPHQIYVREARRMVGDFVLTELHLKGLKEISKSIGMGSYNIDSHNVQRYVATDESGNAYVLNEGDIQVNPGAPYQISYDAIVPKQKDCSNLLVPVCLSSSHIAFGSIRMEPVFMILGQSAATAAVHSIEQEVSVQKISFPKLKNQLLEDGQILELIEDNIIAQGKGINPENLSGMVVDGEKIKLLGQWEKSSSLRPFVGDGYYHDGNGGKGMRSAVFSFIPQKSGLHELKVSFVPAGNRAGSVEYKVEDEKGQSKITIDQRKKGEFDDIWYSLGSYEYKKGKTYSVSLDNQDTQGYVVADAIRVIPLN